MKLNIKILTLILLGFILCTNSVYSQLERNKQAKIKLKGMFIYSFAKNVYWPEKYSAGDFIIAVYGDEDIFKQLQTSYTDNLVGNQKIKLKFYENFKEIKDCHMLYVSSQKNSNLSQVKSLLSEYTLLVSEGQNLASTGSIINFIYVQSRLKYEVNKTKAERNDLKIGQLLTKLAHSII